MSDHQARTAPPLRLTDVEGNVHVIGEDSGQPVVLSFFREASCPYCNFRIYELTNNLPDLARNGVKMLGVFASSEDEIRRFLLQRPRPISMIADPQLSAFDTYGVARETALSKLRALVRRLPALLKGYRLLEGAGPKAKDSRIIPADFLIDGDGRVVDEFYGEDIGHHIPIERIERFVAEQGRRRAAA